MLPNFKNLQEFKNYIIQDMENYSRPADCFRRVIMDAYRKSKSSKGLITLYTKIDEYLSQYDQNWMMERVFSEFKPVPLDHDGGRIIAEKSGVVIKKVHNGYVVKDRKLKSADKFSQWDRAVSKYGYLSGDYSLPVDREPER